MFSTCCLCGQNSRDSHKPLQPSARIPGDPGKHTLCQGHGQVTESGLSEPEHDVFFHSSLSPPSPAPKPRLILERLHKNKASSKVRENDGKAELFLFSNYLISECSSQTGKPHVSGNKPLLKADSKQTPPREEAAVLSSPPLPTPVLPLKRGRRVNCTLIKCLHVHVRTHARSEPRKIWF